MMNENQKLRLELYREFRGEAKQAYDFVMQKDNTEEPPKEVTDGEDGIYLIYEDGHAELFTGDNSKENVKYVGLKHKDVQFAISLTEHEDVRLLDDESNEKSGVEVYSVRECDALFDLEGQRNTEQLIRRNPKLSDLLKDGEYIPALGQLTLMAHFKDDINDALNYVDAEKLSSLSSTWYWSNTEFSSGISWGVYFSNGHTDTNNKFNRGRIRAVAAFNF